MPLFSYLQVIEERGHARIHSDVLDTIESLPNLQAEGVRILLSGDDRAASIGSLLRNLEAALRRLLEEQEASRDHFSGQCLIHPTTLPFDAPFRIPQRIEFLSPESFEVLTDVIADRALLLAPMEFMQIDAGREAIEMILRDLAGDKDPASAAGPALPFESEPSRRRREALLAQGWRDSADVGSYLGASPSNRNLPASRLRKDGKLLGVWVPHERGYRHPSCQFHNGDVLPVMERLLQLLPATSGSGWDQVEWLYSPHALLSKRKPADLLATEPGQVIAAAEREFEENPDAGW